MKLDPAIQIALSHGDLQKIYDAALHAIKNTSNVAIDSHLHPISCTIAAFVDLVNKEGAAITLTQPTRLPYNCLDDE